MYKPKIGDILFDREGHISGSVPCTYVVLSGEPIREGIGTHEYEYRCWSGRAMEDGSWMGGPVVIMWDIDIGQLELVGTIPSGHTMNNPKRRGY